MDRRDYKVFASLKQRRTDGNPEEIRPPTCVGRAAARIKQITMCHGWAFAKPRKRPHTNFGYVFSTYYGFARIASMTR